MPTIQPSIGALRHPHDRRDYTTGQIGHAVVQNLLESGQPVRVIAREASKLPEAVRQRVDVIEGSHGDAAVVNQAFLGDRAVFWVAPPDEENTGTGVYRVHATGGGGTSADRRN